DVFIRMFRDFLQDRTFTPLLGLEFGSAFDLAIKHLGAATARTIGAGATRTRASGAGIAINAITQRELTRIFRYFFQNLLFFADLRFESTGGLLFTVID
ncbi:MAG: hypothetical protein WBN40_03715, partial [Pseudomonadales bacterium]